MKIHIHLLIVFLLLASFNYLHAQSSRQPNIILIIVDDIGFDVPAVYGGQSFSTPNIDSMARHGKSFTHCESLPMCSPSRVMLLTGKQNFRNYCNWGFLSDTARTLGNLMRNAGYNTGFFGKLELPCSPQKMQNWGWNQYTLFDMIDDTDKNGQRYKSPNLIDKNGRMPDSIINNKYCDDIMVSRLENFINQNTGGSPFFIYYAMSLCHSPFSPTPDDPEYAGWDAVKGRSDTSYFPSMVKYMDKKVGQILDTLRSARLDTNTIVLFTADNPTPSEIYYYANGKRLQGNKTKTRESGTHVPLIAYMPARIAPNSINDDLVDFTDFFPTFAGLAKLPSNSLKQYGILDGVSFYHRLFDKTGDSVRPYIFAHYNPHPGSDNDTLRRWVRDKNYKLYDSTGSKISGAFYNVITDPDEKKPIAAKHLTPAEKALKNNFQHIMDSTGTWLTGPLIGNAAASSITTSGAVLSATITASGATALMERGTNISPQENPYYYDNNLKDSIVQSGTFSQTRTGLLAEKKYYYSGYAMNKNESNNTAYALGTFYTLSMPPLQQPAFLTANNDVCATVKLTWDKAAFPAKGATRAGYLLFYSADSIVLNTNVNGKSPVFVAVNSQTRQVNLQAKLPALPPFTTTIKGLSPDTLYHFVLVPYTYSGTTDATYNYLIDSACTTTSKPHRCGSALMTFGGTGKPASSSSLTMISPNPSHHTFTLRIGNAFVNEPVSIRVSDIAGKTFISTAIAGGSHYTFGEQLQPGVYIVYANAGNINYEFKIIKE